MRESLFSLTIVSTTILYLVQSVLKCFVYINDIETWFYVVLSNISSYVETFIGTYIFCLWYIFLNSFSKLSWFLNFQISIYLNPKRRVALNLYNTLYWLTTNAYLYYINFIESLILKLSLSTYFYIQLKIQFCSVTNLQRNKFKLHNTQLVCNVLFYFEICFVG